MSDALAIAYSLRRLVGFVSPDLQIDFLSAENAELKARLEALERKLSGYTLKQE